MSDSLRADPFAARVIDEAASDLAGALEPSDRAWLVAELGRLLEEDPHLRDALAGARPHAIDQSGERVLGPLDVDDATGTGR